MPATSDRDGSARAERRGWWWAAAVALAALLTLHFTLVLLHVLPPDAVSPRVVRRTTPYVVPRFAQDWRLFAPRPVASDYTAWARGIATSRDGEATTEWLDFTTPVIRAVQRNRLSPWNLRLTMLLNAMYDVANRVGPLQGLFRARILDDWADPVRRPPSLVVLAACGSAALAAAYPGRQFEHVELMLGIQPPLPFADRHAPETARPPAAYVVFRPMPFQRTAPWDAG